ncbi:spermatogenesis-associated serine-rich protein 2 [Anguilla anguilla]|uniref:spermatogenesis-associated serine-rich protein 2 n=1 Tax=Anguilla anguilla TaxID=7936 RepID=UPI0015AD8E82|nr:spermatogenesis-associated serine-rich protein 2 [Anguilla anguilla]XP_035238668.1 spermatogenesis-associated serine-rich protein 2 [Anguilla anguilla]XP_035238669.1 spermatogenesis-associated serine-rich protein 2 [Anguilla anguilla]
MAKKNSHKDTSGVVFDTHSKMVMSQGGTYERMKEKISAVRAVVPNKSNNEIVLVLQHFENCVDRAVQAFVEGSATEILKEWNVTGKKKPKKKKKPKPQPEVPAEPEQAEPDPAKATPPSDGKDEVNGFHANGSVLDVDSLDSLSEQLDSASLDAAELDSEPATPELSDATSGVEVDSKPRPQSQASHFSQGGRSQQGQRGGKPRPRLASGSQPGPAHSSFLPDDGQHGAAGNKKIAPNIDRSVKDLQRCTASLSRYRVVVKDEMDSSIKRMKQTFAELQSCLMDREVALLAEMDKVKAEAMAILDGRQKKAEELRRLTDQSASMSEDQLSELRADIKHFVSERKYDEDLGRAVKFTYELEPLKKSVMGFGQVYHPQTGYSSRSRCSSAASSITGPGALEALAPPQSQAPPPAQAPPQAPPQASGYGGRPAQPHRQGYQGNHRHNYHPGGQRYNSGPHQDRNPNRTYRYQGNRGQGAAAGNAYPSSQPSSTSSSASVTVNGSAQPNPLPPRQDRPATNGLPQRTPRTHCP